ncbi:portal protein [Thiocapsa sp. N5-Cardenillas]|uniref:portal protein n=1 Tax=Thiocapsa sp. N5-Cardenillas TaxID=3137397 RepID=UPI0035B3E4FF
MARPTKQQRLADLHATALQQWNRINAASQDERRQCVEDRRFYSIAGAQWEGPLAEQYENRPRFEVNKVHMAVMRIINEYRNNRIAVDFRAKDGDSDEVADLLDGLYRADCADSAADEAHDNGFEEAAGGGFGAWRLVAKYEDETDPENERQRICFEPIFDADTSVYFDVDAKRYDKADARHCFVLYSVERQSYIDQYADDPASWPKDTITQQFDWSTPNVVYVAEYYVVEEVAQKLRYFETITGEVEIYEDADFDDEGQLEAELEAVGTFETRQRMVKRKRVRKYIMSGGGILEDCGYIAGPNIPIVPVYGKRWFVDNVERCMGAVRLAKDPQRLKNMQLSALAELAARNGWEKPIFTAEQMAGHEALWSNDNIENYPYLLVNSITGPNGEVQPAGPVGYTRAPQIPAAMAGLLQVTETDMADILGRPADADKMVSNISGKAVELIQQRIDMQAFIYMSNMAKSVRREGEIWLGMARELYAEAGRKMKTVTEQGETSSVELMRPVMVGGVQKLENDITAKPYDVTVDVGPAFASRRDATVRAVTGMLQMVSDPQDAKVLQATALMNMDGEGLDPVRKYYRRFLVQIGLEQPTDEEREQMEAEAAQGAQPDAQALYLQAEAEKATAQAAQARATTVKTIADAELSRARTVEALAGVDLDERKGAVDTAKALAEIARAGETPATQGATGQPAMPELGA